MKKFNSVQFGTLAAKNASFVIFHCEKSKHYDGKFKQDPDVILFGLQLRWNGTFGFVGGMLEQGETLEEAVIRESLEEVGVVVDVSELIPLCSHAVNDEFNTHAFTCLVTKDELYKIQQAASGAQDFKAETCGFNVSHLTPRSKKNIMKYPFAKTVKEQLTAFMTKFM